jgi:hypothetical protein
MNLLEKLKGVKLELNVCKITVPELGDEPQFVAELSGDEYDDFVEMWQAFRDRLDEETNKDFKRAAVAFCWCDESRNRFVKNRKELTEVIKQLRSLPNSLTESLFEPANALNAFLGVDVNVKKLLLTAAKKQTNDAGNGELQ